MRLTVSFLLANNNKKLHVNIDEMKKLFEDDMVTNYFLPCAYYLF